MNATKHAEQILEILEEAEKKGANKVKILNMCLNNFFDHVSGDLYNKKTFDAPDVYYKELEENVNMMLDSGDADNKQEFMKSVTSLRVLLNKPAPRKGTIEEALQ
ncbi:MAG: hypothetical protein P8J32_06445 [bacterium]|nr:hypothetical protein [bacterium]